MSNKRIWILGAAGPEMEMIEELLRECGETVVYAGTERGRVTPAEAYRADRLVSPSGEPYRVTDGLANTYGDPARGFAGAYME